MNAPGSRLLAGTLALVFVGVAMPCTVGAETFATLRNAPIDSEPNPRRMSQISDTDLRKARNYPEQPPVIPHSVRDYQVDLNFNKCLTCHGRRAIEESQAPMVSVTHYVDREGQVRAFVSPRRYFCDQCHVTQNQARPPVENEFIDVDDLVTGLGAERRR